MEQYLFEIQEDQQMRLDKYLAEQFPEQTRSYLQKLIKDGEVLVNGKSVKTGYQLSKGDEVSVNIPEPKELDVAPQKMDLDIVYEDEDVILINKPKGMVVHPAPGHTTDTLVNGLLYHCKDNLSGINGVARPGIVHRIDRDTTGILIVCKNDMSHNSIAAQLKEHSINRRYRALVHGNLKENQGTVEGPIGRHPIDRKKMAINEKNGKPAVTHYTVLERFGNYTLIECVLETGRTHQIRVHMSSIGHPLVGDEVYGPAKCPFKLQGQCLHAMVLGFVHPRTGEYMEFSADLPEYFEELLNKLR
ncbi:MAG: RluA family pseudouridine synthase [Lachnospiraceae bacterium]|nr:RluA family pseudouridine synthase [Lachnospiraceae bacterium]